MLGTLSAPTLISDKDVSSWAAFSLTSLTELLESWLALEVSAFSINEKLVRVTDDSEALLVLENVFLWTRFSDTGIILKVEVGWALNSDTCSFNSLGSLWTVLDTKFSLLGISGLTVFRLRTSSVFEFVS